MGGNHLTDKKKLRDGKLEGKYKESMANLNKAQDKFDEMDFETLGDAMYSTKQTFTTLHDRLCDAEELNQGIMKEIDAAVEYLRSGLAEEALRTLQGERTND